MPPPVSPSGAPLTPDQKAQELKNLLVKLRTAPAAPINPASAEIKELKKKIEDTNRVDILKASQVELDSLKVEVEAAKNNKDIMDALGTEKVNLEKMNLDITTQINKTRSAASTVLLTDIKDDVLQLGKDSIPEEKGDVISMVQGLMIKFNKLKLMFKKMTTFSAAGKAEIAKMEKQLAVDEFGLLGPRGLRDKFKKKGADYGVSIRNGIRDKTAYNKYVEKFKKGDILNIDEFVDQELAIASPQLNASTGAPKETTMYGLLALKGQETKLASAMGKERELMYEDGLEKYGVKFENNILTVRNLVDSKTYNYTLSTGADVPAAALAAAKKAGAPGISLDVMGLLGASKGVKFTSADIEDQGDGKNDKVMGFAFQGTAGPMGLSKHRGNVSLDNATLRSVLKELGAGDATGLKKLVDRKIVSKGIFAKIKGDIEFKIEKSS